MSSFFRRIERHLKPVFWIATFGTVAMWAVACSISSSDGSTPDGGSISGDDDYLPGDGGTKDAQPDVVCSYPPVVNDPACPSTYVYTYAGQACAPVGLFCMYPGAGDGENGCFATAELRCTGDGGVDDFDAALPDGGDAGREGTWTAAQ